MNRVLDSSAAPSLLLGIATAYILSLGPASKVYLASSLGRGVGLDPVALRSHRVLQGIMVSAIVL